MACGIAGCQGLCTSCFPDERLNNAQPVSSVPRNNGHGRAAQIDSEAFISQEHVARMAVGCGQVAGGTGGRQRIATVRLMRLRVAISLFTLVAAGPSAFAQDYPTRRAGHWELTLTLEDGSAAPQVIQQCVDAESDLLLHTFGGLMVAGTTCTSTQRKDGANLHVDTVCKVDDKITATLQTVFTGDFNASYTVRAMTRVEGEPAATATPPRTMLIAAKWLGACKPDQRPGDIVLPGGKRMNVIEFRDTMEKLRILMKKKSGNP